ncbi:MAG: NAD(P)/FAD-dependent oxidoreductase [Terriglobales bacterium]
MIGAGPAGLTAAYELLTRTSLRPIVLERSTYMGGISRTITYKGNRMDIGGHRFFSKSDRVMNWWLEQVPLAKNGHAGAELAMLLRSRKSRIYFLRKFFDYPIQLTVATLRNLGVRRTVRIGFSYAKSALRPIRPVENLEQFFINRFGRELYLTFFKAYTEKVWGVPCDRISAEWGAQRVKGLSVRKAVAHFLKSGVRRLSADFKQKSTETSLIEQFLYPRHGPGQMWEEVARKVSMLGGEIITGFEVTGVEACDGRITAVSGTDSAGRQRKFRGDLFFSTMAVKDLVNCLDAPVPRDVREIATGLMYRDFITVGLLLNKLKVRERGDPFGKLIADNWIYIQEPDVLAGRLQIFNNWSPHLVKDPSKVWLGVEYFCNEGDGLWKRSDDDMARLAIDELAKIGIIESSDVLDSTVARMPKTYPAYLGTYDRFDEVRRFLDGFDNLYLIGRNGMHRYNNQDHSMLTAMTAVDNIIARRADKSNIWAVNTETEYHESKQGES